MSDIDKQEIQQAIKKYIIRALTGPSSECKVEFVPELVKILHGIMGVL